MPMAMPRPRPSTVVVVVYYTNIDKLGTTHFSALMALEMRVKFIIAVRNRSIAVSIIPPLCKIRETSSALIQILSNVEPTVGEDADMLYVTLE